MMKFISPVEIWTNKQHPRRVYQSRKIKFEYQDGESCYYLDKSDILVLLTPCMHERYFDMLYVLLDVSKHIFTVLNAPNFRLTEVEKGVIRQDIDFRYVYDEDVKLQISKDNEKLVELKLLEWHDIRHIDKVCLYS